MISVALKTPLQKEGICIYKTSLLHRPDGYIGFTPSCPPTFYTKIAPMSPNPLGGRSLLSALRRLKPGKSPELDSIFPKFILHAGSALKSWFCNFLNSCMRQLKIPKFSRRALAVAVPKPEKPLGDPKSYRPMSLLCVPFKTGNGQ